MDKVGGLVKVRFKYQGRELFIMRYRGRVRCVATTVKEKVKVRIMVRG